MSIIYTFKAIILIISAGVVYHLPLVDIIQCLIKWITPPVKDMELIKFHVWRDLKFFFKEINQTAYFQKQVRNQINNLFPSNPSQPSVLFFLSSEDSTETAACFAQKLQKIISRAFEDETLVSFESKNFIKINGTSVKHSLDETLSKLQNNHVAILYNLEQLQPEAAMLLHAYCDNENAPHKRALIVLTMETSSSYEPLSNKEIRSIADDRLERLWKEDIKEVDIPAILSRITNAVIQLKPEPSEVIEVLCPKQVEL